MKPFSCEAWFKSPPAPLTFSFVLGTHPFTSSWCFISCGTITLAICCFHFMKGWPFPTMQCKKASKIGIQFILFALYTSKKRFQTTTGTAAHEWSQHVKHNLKAHGKQAHQCTHTTINANATAQGKYGLRGPDWHYSPLYAERENSVTPQIKLWAFDSARTFCPSSVRPVSAPLLAARESRNSSSTATGLNG